LKACHSGGPFSLSDPNMVKFCRQGLEDIIGEGVDLLFCNYDEAILYSETSDLDSAIAKLSKITKTLVVTLGAEGAVIVTQEKTIKIEGNKVEAVDSNGAGDLFAGTFLHALANNLSLSMAGNVASFASALLVTQFGPRLSKEKIVEVIAYAKSIGA